MLKDTDFDVTKYLIQFCYTCAEAANCTTEQACYECWAANSIVADQQDEDDETQELLRRYAL